MSITTDARGTVSTCHRCHYWSSAWQATCRECGSTMNMLTDADGTIGECPRCGPSGRPHTAWAASSPVSTSRQPLDWSDRAESIWRRTLPLQGSLGEVYLFYRKCMLPPVDSDVRFLPAGSDYPPSLCSRVTDVITAQPISLHFTRLATDGRGKAGTDRDKLLLAGHRKKGGCIRVWPNESVTSGLGLAEGIESALSAAHGYSPIWATIDAGELARFPVLAGVETLVIFIDGDDTGIDAAATCGERWNKAGREVSLVMPSIAGTDMNDEVMH